MSVNQLKLKRSAVSGKQPTTSSLALGELAVNTVDGKVFLKKDDGVQTIVEIATTSGSINFASTSSYATNFNVANALTASVISGSLWNFQGTPYHIPFFSSSQILKDSAMFQVNINGVSSIALNQNGVNSTAPEALFVYQESTSSYNVISGKGNLDNYLQLNIQNVNAGPTASSDVVATANNGNETSNYIDMGINSSNFSGPVGEANDAYLYSTGQHLHIGNASANQPLGLFVGGIDAEANRKLQLNPNNQHNMTGSLEMSGSLNVNFNVTASNIRVTNTLTAQTLVVQTVSSSVIYSSGSNTFGNNLSNNQIFTGSVAITGSLNLKGNQTVTNGSINVVNGNISIDGVNVLDTALAYAIALG
jgi:phage baseplate assembly protein gpV